MFLIFTDKRKMEEELREKVAMNQLESFKQIKYVMILLKANDVDCYDIHIISKALAILTKFHTSN